MINRSEMKARGKNLMQQYYLKAVVAALVLLICASGWQLSLGSMTLFRVGSFSSYGFRRVLNGLMGGACGIAGIGIRFFLLKPLELGIRRFFVDSTFHDTDPKVAVSPFYTNYANIVKVMFFAELYTFLWGLLFYIPGVIKQYEYRMVPYLLLENPDMDVNTALSRSKQIMNGHKWEAFLFDMSFFGWALLSAVTMGLAGVFFGNPYKAFSDAQYFLALRSTAWNNVRPEQITSGNAYQRVNQRAY